MTTLDLDPIKERLAAATPGPWRVWRDPDPTRARATAVETAWCYGDIEGDTELITDYLPTDADATFIANTPSDLAALVAEVERLRVTVIVEQNRRQPWVKLAHQNSQEVKRLRGQIDAVRALHRPAHAVSSGNGGTIYEDPCPECHGAPGVHPCGCWADTQIEYVCAECHSLGVLSKGVYDYDYPCPTIHALEAA